MSNNNSILSSEFDPNLLLDSTLNVPFHDDLDLFYSSLLSDIKDEKLREAIINIKETRLSLGNLSHAIYLLPWSVQPRNETLESRSNIQSQQKNLRGRNNLKISLQRFISRSKREAKLSESLLNLRLTGCLSSNNLCYKYLRRTYRSKRRVTIVCRINGKITKYNGNLSFFDKSCNILLTDVNALNEIHQHMPFIYIKSV